jgi:predicted DCC family thiol-disulfide oxidoreductase YuxK
MNSEWTEETDGKEGTRLTLTTVIDHSAEDSARYSTGPDISHQPKRCSARCHPRISRSARFRGWILFDGACPSCTAAARRFDRIFRRRGFFFLPLQTRWVMHRFNLEPDAPLEEMHVLTSNSRDIAGADALIFLTRQIWWAWPVFAFAQLPGMHTLLDRGYRWIAAHRGCGHVACDVSHRRLSRRFAGTEGPSRTGDWRQALLEASPAWLALVILPMDALLLRHRVPPWQFMWLMTAAIFFGCKWLTAWRAVKPEADLTLARTLGYFFAWPGMDAKKFLASEPFHPKLDCLKQSSLTSVRDISGRRQELPLTVDGVRSGPALKHVPPLIAPIAKILLGALLLFGVARFAHQPLIAGWIGMIGMILILHFGLFQLLALGCRKAGMDVEPIMNAPLRSKSIAEFWGRRWNSAFNRLAFEFISHPLARWIGRRSASDARWSRRSSPLHFTTLLAMPAAFFVSGLIHELVISLPARAGYGLPTSYFLLQAVGILLERARPQIRGRVFTILVTAVPAFWLFHPPFVRHVSLPFMEAMGAL